MRHDIRLTGSAFSLRPVTLADAADIVALRMHPRLGRFIHETSERVEDQEAWLERYFEREGDWYFAVVRADTGTFEGVAGIYDLSRETGCAEWGRWIIKPGSLAAIESVLLVYRAAFEVIGLDAVYCRTVADNLQAVSFQDSTGAPRYQLLKGSAMIRDIAHDQVEHRVDRARWAEMEPRLTQLAQLTAARYNRQTV
jgi:RimJ/RimL family protein N-acetyltransferase